MDIPVHIRPFYDLELHVVGDGFWKPACENHGLLRYSEHGYPPLVNSRHSSHEVAGCELIHVEKPVQTTARQLSLLSPDKPRSNDWLAQPAQITKKKRAHPQDTDEFRD